VSRWTTPLAQRTLRCEQRPWGPHLALELEGSAYRFVAYYHGERLHESLGNVMPDDMYAGRQREIVTRREKIKRLTLERRKKENLRNAA